MTIAQLHGPSRPPESGAASHLILFLHGLGADGADLLGLADFFTADFPNAHCVGPNAPFPCDMAPFGYQWFSLQSRAMDDMLDGVQKAEPILNRYIDEQLAALKLTDDKLIVIGFSQGTMTALHTLLRRPKPCAAIVGYSGVMLAMDDSIVNDIKSRPPVCLIHGDADTVVPFDALGYSVNVLTHCKVPVEYHPRPGLAHGIDPEGIEIAQAFLKKHVSV